MANLKPKEVFPKKIWKAIKGSNENELRSMVILWSKCFKEIQRERKIPLEEFTSELLKHRGMSLKTKSKRDVSTVNLKETF